ncbi:HNH endonuclease [Mycolicibacterium sp. S2-37]|uniref:HNH endonuclease signature motif containing protein n=1 Tax=Mycolicibacterium sp. S2-37 TaxID=2810297 RepID=UPI001A93E7D8|nr:HNH endonuclease signature motif containing protein [Mycolicibacterium sp. S2-37]MBO0676855.1 HNH endonuclease [Mycolicibacterium sp. S2-37]
MLWLDIPGRAGFQASDQGEIARNGQVKRQRQAKNGAMQVDIGDKTCMVHLLVAAAFYGQSMGRGFWVRHRNGDRSDNRPENLIWAGRLTSLPPPTLTAPVELEQEYERVKAERLALIELMQS